MIIMVGVVGVIFWFVTQLINHENLQKPDSNEAVKVYVKEAGIYSIPVAKLIDHGLLKDAEEAEHVKLYNQGREQPIWVYGEGDRKELRFYGKLSTSQYSKENVYWLVAYSLLPSQLDWNERTEKLTSDSGSLPFESQWEVMDPLPANAYYAVEYKDENLLYKPTVEKGDHWLWEKIPSHGRIDIEFELTHILEGTSYLHISIWSETEASVSPDHHVQIQVNGQRISDDTWDGKGFHMIKAVIPAHIFVEGINIITLLTPGVEGVLVEINNLDWIELTIPRSPIADGDRLYFHGTGQQLTLSGFSGQVEAFLLDPLSIDQQIMMVQPVMQSKGEIVVPTQAGKEYLAIGPTGTLKPERLESVCLEPDLRASEFFGDYLVVGPEDLLEPLEPLLALRQGQGLVTKKIPLQAIYDQFSYGIPEPAGIQRFIQYAFQHWKQPPQYLLLVGGASYDPAGFLAPPEKNRVPTFLVQTFSGGQTASDLPYGFLSALDEEGYQLEPTLAPALVIGRIPAQDARQVTALVEKILVYESLIDEKKLVNPTSIVAVADGQGEGFRNEAEKFLNQFNQPYSKKLYAPPPGATNAEKDITEFFTNEIFLLSYFGHGSITMWGKDALFTIEGVENLPTGSVIPLIVNMTCLTGLFSHPEVESIAEALLWKEDGGALVVIAPTSLTLPVDQSELSVALAKNLSSQKLQTIGQAFWEAQKSVTLVTPSMRDVILTYLLLGDPALRLPAP